MFDTPLSLLAPHPCCNCGKLGALLCDNCKYDISFDTYSACIVCRGIAKGANLCSGCKVAYDRLWCVGEREGALKHVIDKYKFERCYRAHEPLGELLSERIGILPRSAVLVPVPTIASHIRVRGYDHALLLARQVGRLQNLPVSPALARATNAVQHKASRRTRRIQAKQAFRLAKPLRSNTLYVLIDDVFTTGATLEYAARTLKTAGVPEVWAAVLARQPLD